MYSPSIEIQHVSLVISQGIHLNKRAPKIWGSENQPKNKNTGNEWSSSVMLN